MAVKAVLFDLLPVNSIFLASPSVQDFYALGVDSYYLRL